MLSHIKGVSASSRIEAFTHFFIKKFNQTLSISVRQQVSHHFLYKLLQLKMTVGKLPN